MKVCTNNLFPHVFENKYSQRNTETGLKVYEDIMTMHCYVHYYCKQKSEVEMMIFSNGKWVPLTFKTSMADMVDCQIEMYPIILITNYKTLKNCWSTVYRIAACKHWSCTAQQARPPCLSVKHKPIYLKQIVSPVKPKAALTECVIGNIFHSNVNLQCFTCSLSKATHCSFTAQYINTWE